MSDVILSVCSCGCGTEIAADRKWVRGHHIGIVNKIRWQDPTYRAKMIAHNRANAYRQWNDPAFRGLRSKQQAVYMKARPERYAAMLKAATSPEIRQKTQLAVSIATSRRNYEQWQDPIYRERKGHQHSEAMKLWWAEHPEARVIKSREMGITAHRLWKDPIHRERISLQNGERARKWFRYSYKRKDGTVVNVKSRAELAYASYLDNLGVAWSYEPIWLCLSNGSRYLPDFYVTEWKCYIEIKGWPWNYEKYDMAVAEGFPMKLVPYKEAIQCQKYQS